MNLPAITTARVLEGAAREHADSLVCVGLGLEALAELLMEGGEDRMTTDQVNGLHHAIIALGRLAKAAGHDLASITERSAFERNGECHA
ncbi:hypothetical protein OF001_U80020 [Pseudomonas sp. OF001]|uniref:hypothetical protein n=1 Tax=unclassified Pseudomonas TaxID=196821 RepID=UPI00191B19DC|nr:MULTISPECIES: hypothetical protein [unclassified Pseudomonas]WPP44043.1 hypothetical protein SK095_12215 [Pseudomonas sp. AN-1]CAD5379717.1 hypothetical protein OF001_U80020 [Pseudomonas sp. OF001]